MKNELLTIGPFTVYGYGLMIAIGILAGCLTAEYRAGKREGIEQGTETTQKKLIHNLMESQKITEDEARKMLGI